MQEKYKEDTVILREGEEGKYMFLVIEGNVALYINYQKENEYLLGMCNKGNVFGEMGILCHDLSMYTAVAVNDVKAVKIAEEELGSFIKKYPEQAIGIMRSTARMNKVLNVNLKMLMEESQQMELQKSLFDDYVIIDASIGETSTKRVAPRAVPKYSSAKWHSSKK